MIEPDLQPEETAVSSPKLDTFAKIERAIFETADTLFTAVTDAISRPFANPSQPSQRVDEPDPDQQPATYRQKRIFYWAGLAALSLDQITKWIVEATIPLNSSVEIEALLPYFRFTHVANTGAAFGLFPNASFIFVILAMILSFVIAQFNYQLPTRSRTIRLTLGVVFGGALGNLVDRFRIGHVTDFFNFNLRSLIDWPILDWPVFNIADACVVFGMLFLAYQMLKMQDTLYRQEEQEKLETAVATILPKLLQQLEAEGKIRIVANGVDEDALPPFLETRPSQNNYSHTYYE